jgi:hypothetical protein
LSFVFFTDRDLGKQFPAILTAAGLSVERHIDHFDDRTPDPEWLEAISKRGWIAVTHDANIRYRPNELEAVRRHSVALLVVVGKAPYADLAQSFVRTRLKIESFLQERQPPYIAKIYRPTPSEAAQGALAGRVELWWPRA